MSVHKNNTEALSQYLQSMVKLEELQKMTEDLDKELEDSQRLMSEIKSIFSTIPNGEQRTPPLCDDLKREQLAQFLAADGPRLMIPDMAEAVDVDIETLLAGLKNHAEELQRNVAQFENQLESSDMPKENLNFEQYAASLDEFSKTLANIKLNRANGNARNAIFESKFAEICENVNNLTQAVQTKIKIIEANKNGTVNQVDNDSALLYNNLINKLIHSINEAIYLLQNRI